MNRGQRHAGRLARLTVGRHTGRPGRATFSVRARPELHPEARHAVLDCPHSTTSATVLPGPDGLPPPTEKLGVLLMKRSLAGGACRCTDALTRRYGATLPAGRVAWMLTGVSEGAA